MAEFNFYQDVKMTVWGRCKFSVKAESLEEAIEIAKLHGGEDICKMCDIHSDDRITFNEWELLNDTLEDITVEGNNGDPTLETYWGKPGPFFTDGGFVTNNILCNGKFKNEIR